MVRVQFSPLLKFVHTTVKDGYLAEGLMLRVDHSVVIPSASLTLRNIATVVGMLQSATVYPGGEDAGICRGCSGEMYPSQVHWSMSPGTPQVRVTCSFGQTEPPGVTVRLVH